MSIPKCTGKYKVGCVDIMTKPSTIPQSVHPRSLLSTDLGSFVRLYFPCDSSCNKATSQKAYWLPEPNQHLYAHALAAYTNMAGSSALGWLVHKWFGRTTMEALSNVPVIDQPSWKRLQEHPSIKDNEKLPLIIFSHGLGSQRAMYSVFCTQLASEGFVVAAAEHRDGSANFTFTQDDSGRVVEVPYFKATTEEEQKEMMKIRSMQLEKRTNEVVSLLDLMEKLDTTPEEIDNCINTGYDITKFKGRVDTSCPLIMGHSFGGVTALSALKKDPRLKCGIGLDPWMEPLLEEFYTPNNESNKPTLVIFTENWNRAMNERQWKGFEKHCENEKGCVEVVTLKKGRHYDQCDVPAVLPNFVLNMFLGRNKDIIPFVKGAEVQRKIVSDYIWKFFEKKDTLGPVHLLDDSYDVDDMFYIGSNL